MKAVREIDVLRSEVAQHAANSAHTIDFGKMKIIDREVNWRKRLVKEAWWTRKFNSANRTKFNLSDSWFY